MHICHCLLAATSAGSKYRSAGHDCQHVLHSAEHCVQPVIHLWRRALERSRVCGLARGVKRHCRHAASHVLYLDVCLPKREER